ncbi:MAG: LLM class flavin-dependent oxidoreductase [Proteobacteria bacterium]|nr:LLM class flavin-dependent oxidoreductase [Pseudomonadota bacterium]
MEFNNFLGAYYPNTSYGGERLYADMLEQARLVDRLGFRGVTIPEHHLINILLIPDPLQFAVKVASVTRSVELVTSVCVLPLHDMRVFAGQVVQADILCDGRLVLGVGRGAFAYELARLGKPIEESRERFDESLNVLQALLTREEVSWSGKYYRFEPLTVMPRPRGQRPPPIMIAALVPEAIEASAARGFHVQTTPLNASVEKMREQVAAFRRGQAAAGGAGADLRLALMRVCCVARDDADARRKLELAYDYYGRFHNVFTGPGLVERGAIRPLPLKQSLEELRQSLLICTAGEMVERLQEHAALGVDDFIMNVNFGQAPGECLEALERFADEVMPHFRAPPRAARAGTRP